MDNAPYVLAPLELAAGYVPGHLPVPPRTRGEGSAPLPALEAALRPALRRPPCVVGFSGGRDSSALLSVAVRLARREGWDVPVPFSLRFPGMPEADESAWQKLVVTHLGLTDWIRHVPGDEVDVLGPVARESLRSHGLLWPPVVHTKRAELRFATGGSYVTGEGGDSVLEASRLSALRVALSPRRRVGARRRARAASSVLPRAPRVGREGMPAEVRRGWLRPPAHRWYENAWKADEGVLAGSPKADLRRLLRQRSLVLAFRNLDHVAAAEDVQCVHPLLDTAFVEAVGSAFGPLGITSRTAAMRTLFGELLPDSVLARGDKAHFNRAHFGVHARAFAKQWDGSGVDARLVDPLALAEDWRGPEPHGGTYQLLQAAWLAAQQGSGET